VVEEAAHAAAELAPDMVMAAAEMASAAKFIPGMPAVAATMAPTFMTMALMAPAVVEVFEKHRIFSVTVSIYR
jgi:hypothetical protein